MGHAVTWLVHPYGFRIDGEHVEKLDSGYVDLDYSGLAALLADLVGEGMGNIMGHAPVKGLDDLTSGRSGRSMPIGYSAAVHDGHDCGGIDRALVGVRALLGT